MQTDDDDGDDKSDALDRRRSDSRANEIVHGHASTRDRSTATRRLTSTQSEALPCSVINKRGPLNDPASAGKREGA